MSAPHLNRPLVLEAADRAGDGAGGYSGTWTELGLLWAEMTPRGGRERAGAETPVSTVSYRILVRAAPVGATGRPQPGQRFRDGARRFAITAVSEWGQGGRYLACHADEEVSI